MFGLKTYQVNIFLIFPDDFDICILILKIKKKLFLSVSCTTNTKFYDWLIFLCEWELE